MSELHLQYLASYFFGAAVLVAMLLWIMIVRWRQASGPRRRSLAPVALVALVLVVAYALREALRAAAPSPPLVDGLDLVVITTLMLWPLAFLAGLARTRLDRSAVGDLAVELSESLPPGRLEQALAHLREDLSSVRTGRASGSVTTSSDAISR